MPRALTLAFVVTLAIGCSRDESPMTRVDSQPVVSQPSAGTPAPLAPIPASRFARLFEELSEPDQYYFSDNFVSNETSYLHVTRALRDGARKRGAYIGVGPEQNFSYIAMVEPAIAFVVDLRRQNALLHLLYKVAFETATSRTHFLALLLGREWDKASDPGNSASIEAVLAVLDKLPPSTSDWAGTVREKLVDNLGLRLTEKDQEGLLRAVRAFAKRGLDLRFELNGANPRRYPTLRELLTAEDENGRQVGFVADERAFRFVQELHRKNRILPVVGDFAGNHALRAIARELRSTDVPVSVFYVSNVEQYLLAPEQWKAWIANVEALPTNEQSLFVRAYLEQGRRHPLQRPGHRTATLVGSFDQFRWRERTRGHRTYWQIVNDEVLVNPRAP